MHLVPRDKDFIVNHGTNYAGDMSDVVSLGKSDRVGIIQKISLSFGEYSKAGK